jgi:SpoVK/Ycf46/Vps4 family AAA+-type ATPase
MNNNDLRLLLHSKVALVVLETYDEPRALDMLRTVFQQERLDAFRWSLTEGVAPLGFGLQLQQPEQYCAPEEALRFIKKQQAPSAFVLCDMHPFLDEPKIVRLIKDVVLPNGTSAHHRLVLLSHRVPLPAELKRYAASMELSVPDDEEILSLIRAEASCWAKTHQAERIKTDSATLRKLVNNLRGLPHHDVRRLARGAIADDGAITESDLPEVTRAKFELMDMDGVLHFEYSTAHLGDVGGFNNLKAWLEARRTAVVSSNVQDRPKGALLFGVQGGGKSLAAKAIAGVWGLPLLRLDMGTLFNKYVGETERNLREALKLADTMAPCVLWLDEIEKGLSAGDSDNGTSKRLLGTLLTWMAERKSAVFMVATSNDISQLPPELMRKGRFDEIFFIDLPEAEARRHIFAIHLQKRKIDQASFDLAHLADIAEGFTGAEIEQAVVSALYRAAASDETLTEAHLVNAIQKTQPLSVVMAEQMDALRVWAGERAVRA